MNIDLIKSLLQNMNSIINWINVDTRFNVKIAGENKLEQIITREDLALVLFTDESNQALNHLLKRVLNELEDSFGIATVEVSDLKGNYCSNSFRPNVPIIVSMTYKISMLIVQFLFYV